LFDRVAACVRFGELTGTPESEGRIRDELNVLQVELDEVLKKIEDI
jgi:hypothetical protein